MRIRERIFFDERESKTSLHEGRKSHTSNQGFGDSVSIWNQGRWLEDIELARCVAEEVQGLGGKDKEDHQFQNCNLIYQVSLNEPRAFPRYVACG